jgi:ribosomal protein L11 methyltransferase
MKAKRKRTNQGWTGNVRSRDVGDRLRLVPYWERGVSGSSRLEVIVDPGPSFGAGDHPTTIMALEFLESVFSDETLRPRPHEVLDVGTGTGVLAIAAVLLGADYALGLDIDAAAIFTARRNVALNGLGTMETGKPTVHVAIGSADAVRGPFDLAMANLAAPTLLTLRPHIVQNTGQFLILSGMADAMVEQVLKEYTSDDLSLVSRSQQDGWNGALLRRR